MTNTIQVVKRDGIKEPLDYDKINKILIWATENITGVSASDIAMNAELQIYDGITTEEIHNVLIESAVNMISIDSPNYQYVASKLSNYLLRKKVFNTYDWFPRLNDFITDNVNKGVYDPLFLEKYNEKDFEKIETFIKHSRDEDLTYSGIQQLMDKYLVKDRSNDVHYETPQFAYISISMIICADIEDKKERYKSIKECYDLISTHVISLPTPIVAGVRTPNRQFSSCTLIDVDDTLDSIIASDGAAMKYISKRAGVGLNFRIRGSNSKIRNGEVVHTGIIPFVKKFEATIKSCSQGGIRNGSATCHYPFWHTEIEDIVVLKNNRGNDLNRARRLDHSIQLSRLFYRRFLKDQNISLFSTSDVPGLYEAFGYNEKFDALYEKYEKDSNMPRKTIKARDLMSLISKERLETGRIYIQNIDNVNEQNSFKDKIYMSNLCLSGETKVDIRCYGMNNDEINKYHLKKENNYYITDLNLKELNYLFDIISAQNTNDKYIEVKSKNLTYNTVEYKKITNSALIGKNKEVMRITNDDTNIVCTPDHLIYTNRGYVKAIDLKEHDILDYDDNICLQSYLKIEKIQDKEDVYDITVEDNHNFYANGILVHNCQEIVLPTVPLQHIDDGENSDAEIALCTLAGYNLGAIKNMETLKLASKYIILILDKIIEIQDYPVEAAKKMLKRRSIGVGVTNYAYWLIKNDLEYGSKDALKQTDELFEHIQYYLLDASAEIAKEKGSCEWFHKTKYADGIYTKDSYNKNVDKLVKRKHTLDWKALKNKIDEHGLRNSVFTALMPVESSSLVSSSINGIELPRALITQKKSKSGSPLPVVVPEISKYKNKYQLAFSVSNNKINDTVSVIQKWIDQAISVNHYYDKSNFEDGNIPMSNVVTDILQFYKFGGKQLYYANSKDNMSDKLSDMIGTDNEEDNIYDDEESCSGGGCSL